MKLIRWKLPVLTSSLVALAGGCAAEPVNPSFPVTAPQAQQAITEMRDDPKSLTRPLVIVGGIFDGIRPLWLKYYFKDLSGDGNRIVPISIALCGTMADCRETVIRAVNKQFPSNDPNWTTEVDVVGLSLGGLVARYAAAPSDQTNQPQRLKIHTLFTVSSPHDGAKIANLIALTDFHRQLRPDSPMLRELAMEDASAGYRLIPYVVLNDDIVGDRHAAPKGVNPYWLANDTFLPPHTWAMLDDRIFADIALRLRGETPFSKPIATPLPF